MNRKRLAIGVSILLGVLTLAVASAETIYAGECLEVDLSNLTSLDNVVYDVVGNSSNLIGMNITLNETTKNASVCFVVNYKPDSFTIIFIDNSTKEIVKEVPVYRSRGTKRVYVDRDVIVEKEVEKIIYVNQTEEPEPIEPEEEENFLWVYVLCGLLVLAIIFMWYRAIKKQKSKVKEKEENGEGI